jgi:hypothetical protein
MFLIKKDQNFSIKIIFCLIYFFCWLSISSSFEDLKISSTNKLNLFDLINFTRQFLIIISVIFLFGLSTKFFFEKKKIKLNNISLYIIFLIYLFLQIPGLIISENNTDNIGFVLSSTCAVLVLMMSEFYMDRVEKKIFLYISVLFLSAVFIVSFLPDFIKYINGERTLYGYYSESYLFLNKMSPRSSGLSRTILFLLILINVFFNQKTNLRKYFFIFFKILCISIILIFQSRTIIFLTFLYLIFDFLSKKNYSPKILISEVVSFIIIPIMIVILLNNLSFFFAQKKISKLEDPSIKYWSIKSFSGSFKEKTRPIENFSSGRFEDWKQIVDEVDKRFIIGFGAQGDRFLINQTASNGILYALTSSGFIGLFFFLFFTLKIFFIALKNIFLAIFFEKNEIFFNFLIIIILMRSVLESSYAVFGIDLIILMTIINYISKAKNN